MKILLDNKEETRTGYGFLNFNMTVKLTFYPFEFVILPFFILSRYKEPFQYYKWYFTFRWLFLFIVIYHK